MQPHLPLNEMVEHMTFFFLHVNLGLVLLAIFSFFLSSPPFHRKTSVREYSSPPKYLRVLDLDSPEEMEHAGYGIPSQSGQKGPRLSRNDEKWESLRYEVHELYMIENNSLPTTMLLIEKKHGFKAS
jgi:Clr5 domain